MPTYVEFPLEGGGSILIETPDEPEKSQAGFTRAGAAETARGMVDQAKQSFDASIENVRRSADLLVRKLRTLSDPPDEMEVNFSLKATGELGNIAVGKAGAECNYVVSLRWRREGEKEREREKEKEEGQDKGHEETSGAQGEG